MLDTSQGHRLSSELLGLISSIRDQFQTGITSAFEIGGAGAAQHFVELVLPELTASGCRRLRRTSSCGLPADGSVDVLLKPLIDAEAKADASAILSSLAGRRSDRSDHRLHHGTSADGCDRTADRRDRPSLLAGQYGIDVTPQLKEFTPAEIAQPRPLSTRTRSLSR